MSAGHSKWSYAPDHNSTSSEADGAQVYNRAVEMLLAKRAELEGSKPQATVVGEFIDFAVDVAGRKGYVVGRRGLQVADHLAYRICRLSVIFLVIVTMSGLGLGLGVAAASGHGAVAAAHSTGLTSTSQPTKAPVT